MRFHRCLLIACGMLSHACDSKPAGPPAPPPSPRPPADAGVARSIVVVADEDGFAIAGVRVTTAGLSDKLAAARGDVRIELPAELPCEHAFDVMMAAPRTVPRFVLAAGDAEVPVVFAWSAPADGPGMIATLERGADVQLWSVTGTEGTSSEPKLVAPLDEPGKHALRAALADVATRTGARRMTVIIDRTQPARVLVDLVATVRTTADGEPLFPEVRAVAGAPTFPSTLKLKIVAGDLVDQLADRVMPLRRCTQQALKRDGPLSSLALRVTLELGEGGVVRTARIAGRASAPYATCLAEAMEAWTLDAKPGTYRFELLVRTD